MPQTTTVRLKDETLESVNLIAAATNRSKSYVLQEAVEQYVQRESAVIEQIQQGIKAASEGRTISHKEVKERLRAKGFNV